MTKTGWQNPWVRTVTTLLTAAVMIMIFCFSTETADQSDRTSGMISGVIVSLIYPDYPMFDPVQQKSQKDRNRESPKQAVHTQLERIGQVTHKVRRL